MAARRYYLLWLLLATGCGPRSGDVSGTVTFNGEKVPSGTVSFISEGKLFPAEIQDGLYQVSGVSPGQAIITVVRLDANQLDPYEALNRVRKQMLEKSGTDPIEIDPKVVTDTLQLEALQKKRHLLPLVYSTEATSDLRFTVASGPNTFNIELHEGPKREPESR